MSSSFPWLTALIVVPLLGAVALWVVPAGRARAVALGVSLLELAARRRARSRAFDVADAGSRPAPRGARLDPRVRGVLRGRRRRRGPDPRAHVGADRAAGGPRRLARAGQPDGRHRPAAPLPRARAAARGVHRRRVRGPGRVLLLRPVRGHAHPGLLHDRPVRRGPAAVRGREVPALLADRRPDHARRRHRPVPAGTGRTAGLPHGRTSRASTLDPTAEKLMFCAFFLAFAIKAPMFPVHTWLPDAAQQAPAGTSTLLVGVLDKVGTFGMLTLCLPLFPNASRWAAPVIIVLARGLDPVRRAARHRAEGHHAAHRVHVGVALRVHRAGHLRVHVDVDRGLVVLHGQPRALDRRAVPHRRVPGRPARVAADRRLRRAAEDRAGDRRRRSSSPASSALSLPGLSTFISEFLVIVGTFARHPAAAIVASLGVVLAAIYVLWTYQRMFTGPATAGLAGMPDLCSRERWVVAPLLALMLVFGFVPRTGARPGPPAGDRHAGAGRRAGRACHAAEEGSDVTEFIAPTVDWAALSPVLIVLLAAVVGVLVEAFVPARVRRTVQLGARARRAGRRDRRRRARCGAAWRTPAARSCSAARCWSTDRRWSCRPPSRCSRWSRC